MEDTLAQIMAACKDALEIAADDLQKKEEKNDKKKQLNHHLVDQQQESLKKGKKKQQQSRNFVNLQVKEGEVSKSYKSPRPNRKSERREGVAEKNDTEKKLLKESLKAMTRAENLNDFNIL